MSASKPILLIGLLFPLESTKRIVILWSLLEAVCFKNSILGENMNHHSSAFPVLQDCPSESLSDLFVNMDGRFACSSFSFFCSGTKLVFTSYQPKQMALFLKFAKNWFSISPQGPVKFNCTVVGIRIRPLEFVTHSNQIWKCSWSPV